MCVWVRACMCEEAGREREGERGRVGVSERLSEESQKRARSAPPFTPPSHGSSSLPFPLVRLSLGLPTPPPHPRLSGKNTTSPILAPSNFPAPFPLPSSTIPRRIPSTSASHPVTSMSHPSHPRRIPVTSPCHTRHIPVTFVTPRHIPSHPCHPRHIPCHPRHIPVTFPSRPECRTSGLPPLLCLLRPAGSLGDRARLPPAAGARAGAEGRVRWREMGTPEWK